MDLFHTVTQELENILSCHWLDEFRQSGRSRTTTPGASRSQSATPDLLARSHSNSNSNSNIGSRSASRVSSRRSSTTSEVEKDLARMSANNTKMMDTEPGGEERNQYESQKTFTNPHAKESGQLGGNVPNTTTDDSGVDSERAQKTTDNINYGQNVSESGMGGMTTTSDGSANQEGGYGGTEAQKSSEKQEPAAARGAQQYTPKDGVHDYSIGA